MSIGQDPRRHGVELARSATPRGGLEGFGLYSARVTAVSQNGNGGDPLYDAQSELGDQVLKVEGVRPWNRQVTTAERLPAEVDDACLLFVDRDGTLRLWLNEQINDISCEEAQGMSSSVWLDPGGGTTTGPNDLTGASGFDVRVQPPAGKLWKVEGLAIWIEDDSEEEIGGYLSLPALSTGIRLEVWNSGGLVWDVLAGGSINVDEEWLLAFPQGARGSDRQGGTSFAAATYSVEASLDLNGDNGEYLRVHSPDNFSSLTKHRIIAFFSEIGLD